VARLYQDLLDLYLLDEQDRDEVARVAALGIEARTGETVMKTDAEKAALARTVLDWLAE